MPNSESVDKTTNPYFKNPLVPYIYHIVHVDIPYHQVQKMNGNQLKDKLRKIKTSVWYKKNLDERLLTALEENDPLYVDGAGLTKNQKIKSTIHP